MTTYQSNFNSYTAFKAQSALGSPATGSGGFILRQGGGTPAKLSKAAISPKEVRRDAQHVRGRHGMQSTTGGPYMCDVAVDSVDDIYQALLRGAWDSTFTASSSDFTSITISGGHTITWASGNPITKGFRVNDVIDITGSSVSGNNGKNLRITGLTATTITVAETLSNDATDSGASIVRRGRKVIMPAAGSLVNTYFTVEEYEGDLDASRVFNDCYWKSGKWTMAPNGIISFEPSWVGTGYMELDSGAGAPVLTSPTLPTGQPLAVLDATLRIGSDIADLTSFDLTIDNGAVAPAVAASKLSPTVIGGLNQVSMNLKFLRKDTTWDANFLNETSLSLQVLAVPNMSEPKDFLSISVPFFTLGSADVAALSTSGGAREVSISVPAALIGHDTTGTGYDDTMMSIQVSNTVT